MESLRLHISQDYTPSKWWNQRWNPGCLSLGPRRVTALL